MQTSPGCSPRWARISFTRSSLRKFRFADELNFDSRFDRHLPGILANPVAEGFGKLPIVEDPDFSLIQKRCHPPGKTDLRQRPENQHPIPTTQHTGYLSGVTFRYQLNAHPRIITTVWFRLCRLRIRERDGSEMERQGEKTMTKVERSKLK